MFYTIKKFQERIKELSRRRSVGCDAMAPFTSMEDTQFAKVP